MRVHAIEHPNRDGRWLVNECRPCSKAADACELDHLNIFTDTDLADHDLRTAIAGAERWMAQQ